MNSAEILHALKKLNTLGSVLYIAAHPDDENTRLLAYLANEKKVRSAYLSITRGDGGQNLIGKEQGEPLGLIRTQELLAARRTDGAEQFFTRANDFGYSKNPEETFRIWNHDSILSDMVLAIRRFKPDVIICRFPTTGEGGHGHHTASAILALEAFEAAADPSKFSWQLKIADTWKAKSIYWNTFNFGSTNTTSPSQLKMDVGLYNALLGKGYGEIAAESRSMHKSQGFGSARQRGTAIEYFKFLKGDSAKSDILETTNTTWKRLKGADKIEQSLSTCIQNFRPEMPESTLKDLVAVYKNILALDEADSDIRYWKKIKLAEAEKLILACSGLWIEALASDYAAIPGEMIGINLQAVNRNSSSVTIRKIDFAGFSDTTMSLAMKQNELYTYKRKEKLPASTPFSTPYWLAQPHSEGLYMVSEAALIGKPENDPVLKVNVLLTINDLELTVTRPVVFKSADPVKGEVYRPLEILPPLTVNFPEKVVVFSESTPKTIQLTIKANMPNTSGTIELKASEGFSVALSSPSFTLKNKGDELLVDAVITPGKNASQGKVQAIVNINNITCNQSIRRIEYDHIPYQFILSEAKAGLVCVDLKKNQSKVAYVPGAGDDVENCLKQIGYNVTRLTDEMLGKEDLSKYDAIVTGVRAYNTNEKLQAQNNRLLDYVKNGGNLIVQYNTNSRVGPLQSSIGPYPFTISRDRVTDENAQIRFVNEKHPVLNIPNKITSKDFEGWIQERGIYFANELDKNYETVLSLNDPGEKPLDGSLITCKYGKGNFVYTGLVFFRELPAGIPGAYRLFANLISLTKNK
jgi:LmbE family N-acetylglucosaminyl deacetylase